MSEKIMEILNGDEKSRVMLQKFNEAAERKGLKGSEFEEARKTMMGIIIYNNKEALDLMAEETYNELRAE